MKIDGTSVACVIAACDGTNEFWPPSRTYILYMGYGYLMRSLSAISNVHHFTFNPFVIEFYFFGIFGLDNLLNNMNNNLFRSSE